MKKHYDNIDILKGIAIILVLIAHAIIKYPINLQKIEWCKWLFNFVSTPQMALFFLISGICYSCKNLRVFIKKKLSRLIIPYLTFSITDLAIRIILPTFVNRPTNIYDGIKKILLYGGEYWFLYTLFLIFILYIQIDKLCKNNVNIKKILIVFFYLISCIKLPSLFTINKIVIYLPYFILGTIIKDNIEKISFFIKENKEIEIMLLLLSLASTILYTTFGISLSIKWTYSWIAVITGCLFWFIISNKINKKKFRKMLIKCGRYSLQLYLFNGYLLVLSRVLIINILHISNAIIIIICCTIIPLIITSLIINLVIEKIKIARILVGLK